MILALLVALQLPDTAAYSAAQCPRCAEWNEPAQPRRLWGNTYYVGTRGLGALLITSDSGHVLLDGGLPSTAPMVMANIRSLGFRAEDIRLIGNSHAHYDHAGGLAALQRVSGAEVVALPRAVPVLASGRPDADDPQFGDLLNFPTVSRIRAVADGTTLTLGDIRITPLATEGHSPGGTSWSWRSCADGICRDFVYGDSQTSISADGFRYSGGPASAAFVVGFRTLEMLRCDVLVTPHPGASRLWERVEGSEPLVDAEGCKRYAAGGRQRLSARLAAESAGDDGAFLAHPAAAHLRVMTWNVAHGIFADPGPRGWRNSDGLRPARFQRVVRALRPDVVCLNEIFPPRTAGDVAALLDSALPLPGGRRWQTHKSGDAVIASRFPLAEPAGRHEDFGAGPRAHATALAAVPDAPGRGVYVGCAHFQSRGDSSQIAARTRQAEVMVEWARGLPGNPPLIFMGDWNAYRTDPTVHMRILMDGASLSDAGPLQNGRGPASSTFGDGTGPNPPGELDRVLYSTAAFRLLNSFVLDTTTLSPATLARYGLEADDILLHAGQRLVDHWPVVADLSLQAAR